MGICLSNLREQTMSLFGSKKNNEQSYIETLEKTNEELIKTLEKYSLLNDTVNQNTATISILSESIVALNKFVVALQKRVYDLEDQLDVRGTNLFKRKDLV